MIRLVDVADGHGGDPDLVADAVGEWRLEHATVHRLRANGRLPRRHVDDVDARSMQHAGDFDGILWLYSVAPHPVVCRDAHRDGLLPGPNRAHRAKHLQWKAHAILEAAAVRV